MPESASEEKQDLVGQRALNSERERAGRGRGKSEWPENCKGQ